MTANKYFKGKKTAASMLIQGFLVLLFVFAVVFFLWSLMNYNEKMKQTEEQRAKIEQLSDEIEKTMAEEGEEAAMAIFYNAYLPRMMDAMCDYIRNLDPSEEDWNITLALVDDEWQITSIQSA